MISRLRLPGIPLAVVAMLFAAAVASESRGAEGLALSGDGWHRWQTARDDSVEIFVRLDRGAPVEVFLPGFQCPRRTSPDAVDEGLVAEADSIAWLRGYVSPRTKISNEMLAAIAVHDSDAAVAALLDVLARDGDRDNREEALFWLAQTDNDAAFAALDHLLR